MPTRMKLDELLRAGGFSAAEIRQVHEGALVKVVAESTCDRELAVKFAFLVKAPPSSLKENFMTTVMKIFQILKEKEYLYTDDT